MRRKVLAFLLVLSLILISFSACGSGNKESKVDPELQAIYDAIDIDFSVETTDMISAVGTHPKLGYRLAGSKGEDEAVDYLYERFQEAGLQEVRKYETTVDTWSMTKSDLTYTDKNGSEKVITLGGYPTTFQSSNDEFELIYLDEGTKDDYDGVDATGKIILIDIDQNNNWWINWPAYQAKVKGAACVIAANYDSYGQKDGSMIVAQDTCGPSDAPALSISNDDANILKDLISQSKNNSIKIKIDCDALVTPNGASHNVVGVIPGKTDECIFLMGHIDGYFHAWHDNASGLAMALSIGKAVIDSGYEPEKTIIVIGHGAEEWGIENSRYDWAIGAYEQIFNLTPEWADVGFTVINCESGSARDDDTHLCLGASYELKTTLEDIVIPMSDRAPGETNEIYTPATVWSEDYPYSRAGIPGMVTRKTSGNFNLNTYHTCGDLKEDHYSEPHYRNAHEVYCNVLWSFDKMAVMPLNFETRLTMMADSVNDFCTDKEELLTAIEETRIIAQSLNEKIIDVNSVGLDGDKAKIFNNKLREAFKFTQNSLGAFDWEDNVMFPNECSQNNIELLGLSIECLEKKDVVTPIDEYLFDIDYNWYAYSFDREVYQFFLDQTLQASPDKLAWGIGMIKQGNQDLYDVIQSLNEKYDVASPNVTSEIDSLRQAEYASITKSKQIVGQQIADLKTLKTLLDDLVKL